MKQQLLHARVTYRTYRVTYRTQQLPVSHTERSSCPCHVQNVAAARTPVTCTCAQTNLFYSFYSYYMQQYCMQQRTIAVLGALLTSPVMYSLYDIVEAFLYISDILYIVLLILVFLKLCYLIRHQRLYIKYARRFC